MLKLLGLTVFLLVGVFAVQEPPSNSPKQQITKTESSHVGDAYPEPKTANQSTPPPMVTSPQPNTPTCDEACQQSRENLKIQYRLALFTGLLVAVGILEVISMFLQTFLLLKTRGDVHTQANWMEKQTAHIGEQVDLMKRQMGAMIEEKRARLDFFFKPMIVEDFVKGTVAFAASVELKNRGQSAAYITSHSGKVWVGSERSFPVPQPEANGLTFIKYIILPDNDLIEMSGWSEYAPPTDRKTDEMPIVSFYGFIVYRTLATLWRRDFAYCWYPTNVYEDPFDGATEEGRTIEGKWESDVCQVNQEYEIRENPN